MPFLSALFIGAALVGCRMMPTEPADKATATPPSTPASTSKAPEPDQAPPAKLAGAPAVAPAPGMPVTFDLVSVAPAVAPTARGDLSPTPPTDLPDDPDQSDAITFAWQTFVAVGWPAKAGERGVPDPSKVIGQPGAVVWQTWKQPEEIFLSDGAAPPPWNDWGGVVPAGCTGATTAYDVLGRTAKSDPGSDSEVFRDQQAVGGTLTDQHGNLAYYQLAVDRTSFDYIVTNTLYNVQGQQALPGDVAFPASSGEIKAAWRVLTAQDSPDQKARFFQRRAWIQVPGGPCSQVLLGLVGLHVTRKTPSRPEWVWATFEHVDNVPAYDSTGQPGGTYSFYDPTCPPDKCKPNHSTEQDGKPTGTPTQVTRRTPISEQTQAANKQWQAALADAVEGSPWQYYQLVEVQWPRDPGVGNFGDPTPGRSWNTTMETYVDDSSCLECHYTAATADGGKDADFSFTLAEAHPVSPGSNP